MKNESTQRSIRYRLERRGGVFRPFSVADHDTVSSVFSQVAAKHPDKVAIVSGESTLTYSQLECRSRQITHKISQQVEAATNPIAIMISLHTQFAASVLGVLRAGSCYIPIDPEFPEARIAQMLEIAGVRTVLTERVHSDLVERLLSVGQTAIYVDDDMPAQAHPDYATNAASETSADHDRSGAAALACIIFTSGSTGKPKGVMQTNRNLLQVVRRYTNSLCLTESDRVSLLSSCSVTASIAPMFASLLNGATLCAFSVRLHGLVALADWLDVSRITLYHSVPSLFRQLMRSVPDDRRFKHIEVVRMGGDSVRGEDWELFSAHCKESSVFVNSYGCSEMSTVACFYLDASSRPPGTLVPVGFPLQDVEIFLKSDDGAEIRLEASGEVGCDGTVGEIVLRSRYLSSGYWHSTNATNAAFKASCTEPDIRSYQTGDVGVISPDCGLLHMGRGDSQVKIAGFRVEIAEIEACLRKYHGVSDAAVLVSTRNLGEKELVSFVETVADSFVSGPDVRAYVQNKLPPYMVPSEVLPVEKFPRTPNGKLDRAALLELRERMRAAKLWSVGTTRTEERLSKIWAEVLGQSQVGVSDDFFELGGNSLLGMKLVVRVLEAFEVNLPALAVFEYPTVKEMASAIDSSMADDDNPKVSYFPGSAVFEGEHKRDE